MLAIAGMWVAVGCTRQRVIDDAFNEAIRSDPERHRRRVVLVDVEP